MDKSKNTQDEIEKALALHLLGCVRKISKLQEEEGIDKEGVTIFVGGVGVDGKDWDMTISLTPKGSFAEFDVIQHRKHINPTCFISN